MPRRPSPHPTEAELEILNVLWRRGPRTVRQVHEALQADRETTLTTTLKLLQVMTEKGLSTRDAAARPHRYIATKPEKRTQAGLLDELARRAFGGSMRKLLVRAVEEGDLSAEELDDIQKLVDKLRKGQRGGRP